MPYADLLNDFINAGMSAVHFYRINSNGAVQYLLLDDQGSELAWRWEADGSLRWRDNTVAQSAFTVLPSGADTIDLSHGLSLALFNSNLLGVD